MTPTGGKHPTPDEIMAYGQGRVDASQAGRIEEHLLTCARCCEILKEVPPDSFIDLLREAGPGASQRPTVSGQPGIPDPLHGRMVRTWVLWILVIFGLLALGTLVLIVLKRPGD